MNDVNVCGLKCKMYLYCHTNPLKKLLKCICKQFIKWH